ncbi:MAG: hypothetical protein U0163_10020 [Gemmatimonadaceae bacterium]
MTASVIHRTPVSVFTAVLVTLATLASVTPLARAQSPAPTPASALETLSWRHIGPASFGGRIDDIEAVPSRPGTIFVGSAGGGVFRSRNNGVTWDPVFDKAGGSVSIGDIAIAPSDPNVIWVGTGEANSRQSSTWGDGVYRSLDGGDTWTPMGLRDSHHVGRIVIHPRDPNTLFVAAVGHLWGPNAERGLYRTRDAGRTWQRVLYVDDNTGAIDVALDADGRTVYAAMYQRQRRGFGFVGGGAGSGLYRSLDGGDSWERLTKGLPSGPTGRIGIAIAPSQSNIVYAIIENRRGGVFRSEDRGATWTRMNGLDPRPMYYSNVRVDPLHPDHVWVVASNLHKSIDGGKTFTTDGTGDRIHVDHHALWIDPNDPDHMLLGNDGGLYFSYDGSRHWDFINNLPIGQYYDIDIDDRDPYWIFGGTQDNGSWGIPSRTTALVGITNADVVNTAYGDGFYATADRRNPRYVFANSQNGRAYRVDLETREEQGIRPVPKDAKEEYRFNWNSPQLRSPHDPGIIYYGGNKLFRTRDNGTTWEEASPDLSRNQDWKKLPIMGVVRDSTTLSRDDGVDGYGSITTIAESPVTAGVLLVGTDDGNVQLTKDAGKSWQNITDRFKLPAPRWVSRVLWSRHGAGTGYVAFDGHGDDDMAPYLFRTSDGGATWTSIAGDLPAGNPVKSFVEHPRNANFLLAGTEFGLYVTFDGGKHWQLVTANLPRVRVDDVVFNERTNDIILGTHGRSIILLDDARIVEQGDPLASSAPELTLAPIAAASQRYQMRMLPTPGARTFAAPNSTGGSNDHVRNPVRGCRQRLRGATHGHRRVGRSGAHAQGVRRAGCAPPELDLHYDRVEGVSDEDEGWFGSPRGPWVLPGTYTVTLEARGQKKSQTVEVSSDPRVTVTREALVARHTTEMRLQDLLRHVRGGHTALGRGCPRMTAHRHHAQGQTGDARPIGDGAEGRHHASRLRVASSARALVVPSSAIWTSTARCKRPRLPRRSRSSASNARLAHNSPKTWRRSTTCSPVRSPSSCAGREASTELKPVRGGGEAVGAASGPGLPPPGVRRWPRRLTQGAEVDRAGQGFIL